MSRGREGSLKLNHWVRGKWVRMMSSTLLISYLNKEGREIMDYNNLFSSVCQCFPEELCSISRSWDDSSAIAQTVDTVRGKHDTELINWVSILWLAIIIGIVVSTSTEWHRQRGLNICCQRDSRVNIYVSTFYILYEGHKGLLRRYSEDKYVDLLITCVLPSFGKH